MGKIRIRTIGDENEEQEKKEAKKRARLRALDRSDSGQAEEKRIEAAKQASGGNEVKGAGENEETAEVKAEEPSETKEAPKKKPMVKRNGKEKTHSATYLKKAELVDKKKTYKLSDAVALLPKLSIAKFDETVELHINTTDKGISGQMSLPHGTGKQTKVALINPTADAEAADALIKQIEAGTIEFDVLIATPDAMPKLARVARVLGPRGLMPNPKNGTVTPKPEEAAEKFAGGQFNYKTEAKFPILHLIVGKVSFGEAKLEENIKAALKTVSTKNIKNVTLKSTMSPGIKLDVSSI